MKNLLIASVAALAIFAGAPGAGAQTKDQTDPAHPLANPSAPTSDCRSDSMRGGGPPCGPTNTQPSGTQRTAPKNK